MLNRMSDFGSNHFVFRINDNGVGPNLLQQVCLERGWRSYEDKSTPRKPWNLWWRTKAFPVFQGHQLNEEQFTNHIPNASFICRKDNLIRVLKCMKKIYGPSYNFIPVGYNLPSEYKKLLAKCKACDQQKVTTGTYSSHLDATNDEDIWICKPVGLSQGRGISLFQYPVDLVYSSNAVVQKYVKNPLLIGGYKFDLRLYVLVPSFHPLTVYVYKEGLVRFGTEKFSLSNLENRFAHITNSSLNKFGPAYSETKERIGAGCKWNLQQLRCYLRQTIGSNWLLWQNIAVIIVLTIAAQLSRIPSTINSFEFYGFDVLIDSTLKPWLIEVNLSPALSIDCTVDLGVKKPMIHDIFDLIGLPICNTGLLLYENIASKKHSSRRSTEPASHSNARHSSKLEKRTKRLHLSRMTMTENKTDSTRWSNGRNWKHSKPSEGNWVRVFPLLADENSRIRFPKKNNHHRTYDTNEIRTVVSLALSYFKIAKEIQINNPEKDENRLNDLMASHLLPGAKIWLPPL